MEERPRCEINVTPLVDVCLVMLIIFMVVTPMILDKVHLPRTANPDERKRDRAQQVKVAVGPRGDLWLEDAVVEESLLLDMLRDIHERAPQKELVLFADGSLTMNEVRRTMRISGEAGYHSFGLVVQKAAP